MISLRYHVVSIAAVFLALALGVKTLRLMLFPYDRILAALAVVLGDLYTPFADEYLRRTRRSQGR